MSIISSVQPSNRLVRAADSRYRRRRARALRRRDEAEALRCLVRGRLISRDFSITWINKAGFPTRAVTFQWP
jgi:hypothetical protein